MFRGDIVNKKDYPVPLEEIRVHPSRKLDFNTLVSNNKTMMQAYQIMVTKILNRLTSTNLRDLRDLLVYDYFFSNATVDDLIHFITVNPCKHIEFETIDGCLNSDKIYRAPRIKVSVLGPSSIWLPNLK